MTLLASGQTHLASKVDIVASRVYRSVRLLMAFLAQQPSSHLLILIFDSQHEDSVKLGSNLISLSPALKSHGIFSNRNLLVSSSD